MIDGSAPRGRPARSVVIIAMCGSGKTTLAAKRDDVCDVDFGTWRAETQCDDVWQRGSASDKDWMLRRFVRDCIMPKLELGLVVLTNEPDIWPYVPSDVVVITAVPDTRSDFFELWHSNLVMRTAKEHPEMIGVDSFLTRLMKEGQFWPDDDKWRVPGAAQMRLRSYQDLAAIVERLA